MTKALRGVNLGGWLIVEKWLTPGIFKGTDAKDEYSLSRSKNGKQILERHRKTFITENDFAWLKKHSIGLVRIPVGYWLFNSIDGYYPSVAYLDLAMQWAEKYDIKVLVDLHGARGSQNGFDSSGKMGNIEFFDKKQYQDQAIDILCKIADHYKDSPAFWGIELLNEPVSTGNYFKLVAFHRRAYAALKNHVRPGTKIVFHDSFRPLLSTGTLWPWNKNIIMDVHWYAVPAGNVSLQNYLRLSRTIRTLGLWYLKLWHPIMVGEWSTVLPQRYFNETPLDKHMDLLAQNADMQQKVYSHAHSQIYWNYKAEGDGMWNFRDLAERGVIKIK